MNIGLEANTYYGSQTAQARDNFPVSGRVLPLGIIHEIARIKAAAAQVNADLTLVPIDLSGGIIEAAWEVVDGKHDDQFIVDVFQTGSGTSSHMNVNEVVACRANEILTGKRTPKQPVHPNDHVNRGQSSNDVFPTAIHLAGLRQVHQQLLPALDRLQSLLELKGAEFADVVKIGRTHLQDAVPVTLGQEFHGYASMIRGGRTILQTNAELLLELALGGTAVGTGINTHPEFAAHVIAILAKEMKLPLRPATNYFDALGSRRTLVAVSGCLKAVACDLMKIANDLRLLASGPRAGFGEITLPELQPGSSIMPGKVNPVIPEAVCQVAAQVIGNDLAITIGGQSGLLELNVTMPMMATNLLDSMHLLTNVCRLFADKCIRGITANREHCEELAERSLVLATALVPKLGYDAVARIVQRAHRENRTLREVAAEESGLPAAELQALLDPRNLVRIDAATV